MAANEDLSKLSSEQLQKLARVISDAKSLTGQQAEIIEKVLSGEEDIGKLRISYLEQYFDTYSRNLDFVARKYRDDLDDAFFILDRKLEASYKKLDGHKSNTNTVGSDSSDLVEAANSLKYTIQQLTNEVYHGTKDITKVVAELSNSIKAKNSSASQPNEGKQNTSTSNKDAATKDITSYINQETYDNAELVEVLRAAILTKPSVAAETKVASDDKDIRSQTPITVPIAGSLTQEDLTNYISQENTNHVNDLVELLRGTIKASRYGTTAESELAAAKEGSGEGIKVQTTFSEEKRDKLQPETLITKKDIKDQLNILDLETELQAKRKESNEKYLEDLLKAAKEAHDAMLALELEKAQTAEEQANKILEVRIAKITEATKAEYDAQKYLNDQVAEIKFASTTEASALRSSEVNAKDELASAQEQAKKRADFIAKEELKAKLANDGILLKEDVARIQEEAAAKFKFDKESLAKLTKERLKQKEKEEKENQKTKQKENRQQITSAVTGPLTRDHSLVDRFKELKKATDDKLGKNASGGGRLLAGLSTAITAISSLAAQLNGTIDQIAKHQSVIDTRLQGSNNTQYKGSYWDQLTKDMMSVGAITPYFKQEDFAKNIETLVNKGISFDLKQRAFLMTVQEKIANTFDVADGTLLRLVRIQQEDSTAGRLGMESALNSFLNEMYETSEYLSDVAKSVRSSLEEMESLMSGDDATEVEYQVQKWMGSLYSVGMSSTAVQGIAGALGQIAAGQIEGLTGNGAGNLLVMAANNAGKSISDILTTGLNAEETNDLLQATVNYLAEIAESSKDNHVVQQQLANVFGVKASDLKAATNLAVAKDGGKYSIGDIYNSSLTYDNMLSRLNLMVGTMGDRTSLGEKLKNIWENVQYSMASGISSNPTAYFLYKMSSLLESTTGGIDFSFPLVFGSGMTQTFNIADIMRVASLGTGIISSFGDMISGLSNSFSGQAMLSKMGINANSGLAITPRGGDGIGALDIGGGSKTTSGSGYVGNASSSDIKNSTMQEAEDSKNQQMIEALEETPADRVDMINTTVLKIYELLDGVTKGSQTLRVRVENYGLTGAGNTGAQGGVSGLLNGGTSTGFSESAGASTGGFSSSNTGTSGGSGGAVDLGGWTMM